MCIPKIAGNVYGLPERSIIEVISLQRKVKITSAFSGRRINKHSFTLAAEIGSAEVNF